MAASAVSHSGPMGPTHVAMYADTLDAFDRASILGDETLAATILKSINKQVASIAQDILRIEKKITKIQADWSNILPWAKAIYITKANTRDAEKLLPIEKAIAAHDVKAALALLVFGTDCKKKTKDGTSLLYLALTEGQIDVAHKLLIEGLDPNERDKEGRSLLHLAAQKADMRASFLLLAYGANCTDVEAKLLIAHAKTRDPLRISSDDTLLFATSLAYLLARGCSTNQYLPILIDLLGGTWMLYNQLPAIKESSSRLVTVLSLAGLNMLPVTQPAMQFVRCLLASMSAFSGIKAAYDNFAERPLAAITKGVVQSVNVLYSWSMFQASAVREYEEAEFIKSLGQCRNVTAGNILTIDSLPPLERMDWVLNNPHALDCPPVLERTFPGWSCQNQTYKTKFRQDSLVHHPDKPSGNTSSIQTVLNAVYSFWKKRCQPLSQ